MAEYEQGDVVGARPSPVGPSQQMVDEGVQSPLVGAGEVVCEPFDGLLEVGAMAPGWVNPVSS
ncbi:hypothetical protein [Streptomyces sp. NPDC003832]